MVFEKLQAHVQDCGLVVYQNPSSPGSALNDLIGKKITVSISSAPIICLGCQSPSKKIIKGYCYRCSIKLACCDLCILKPELCHYHQGTCRQPDWGLEHCFRPHHLYIALSSSLKIGLTRSPLTRWVDQGASKAAVLLQLSSRREAGLIERHLIEHANWNDKTNWRSLVKGLQHAPEMAQQERERVAELLRIVCDTMGVKPLKIMAPDSPWQILKYPINQYPAIAQSWNLLKEGSLTAELSGICGQYLLFASCNKVINMRNYAGYPISITQEHHDNS